MPKLLKWLSKLPSHREKEEELDKASKRVELAIARYCDVNERIQKEIERNHIAKHLIYDKGE